MKKWLTVLIAVLAVAFTADWAMARGGGRGGGMGGGGRGPGMGGGTRGGTTPRLPDAFRRRNDKKNRELMRERALLENKDSLLRDGLADSE